MIETTADISIREQCMLLGLSVSSYYYRAPTFSEEDERLMVLLDEHYLQYKEHEVFPYLLREIERWVDTKYA